MPGPTASLILLVLTYLIARSLHQGIQLYRRHARDVSHIPGYRIALHPHAIIAAWLPRLGSYLNIGEQYTWRLKHTIFAKHDSDLLSIVSYIPHTRSIVTCDVEAIKHLTSDRKKYVKPLGMYEPLAMFGPNVGVTEEAEWVRHKKIVASSNLLENINQLAWQSTSRTLDQCFEDWKAKMDATGQRQIKIDNVAHLTLKIALFVILSAGFSHTPAWDDASPSSLPASHALSFRTALHGVLKNVWWKIVLPRFAYKLPFCGFFRHIGQCFDEFGQYLEEMVRTRREEGQVVSGRRQADLLGALVQASREDANEEDSDAISKDTKAGLTDREIMGNIYVFLLAGHDTTAHTLAFSFGLLALYPEVQQRLYDDIVGVLPTPETELTYDQVSELRYALAVFYETLRLYPSVVVVPKFAMEDSLVPVQHFRKRGDASSSEGVKKVLIPKHAEILIDVPALHYNPRYWGSDAAEFRPERFLDDEATGYKWPREAFMGFSQGPRACLGQKFAQVEAVVVLSEIIRRYEVHIDPSALRAGESVQDARHRLMDGCKTVITLTPKPLPVIFEERRRQSSM